MIFPNKSPESSFHHSSYPSQWNDYVYSQFMSSAEIILYMASDVLEMTINLFTLYWKRICHFYSFIIHGFEL